MKFIRALAIFSALLSVFASPLSAKPRSCRIVFPERPKDAPKFAFLYDGTRNHAVTLPSMNLSEVIELPDGEIAVALTAREIKEPEDLSPHAPLLKIPETVKEFYIIILSDPNNKELPVKMSLVNTGEGKLNPGETLWYNFTEHRIVAKLGQGKMMLEPKGRTISKDPGAASGYYDARFAFQAHGTAPLAPITEQRWWHDAGSRHLGFVANTGGKLPRIYFFRDFRNPEPPEEENAGTELE